MLGALNVTRATGLRHMGVRPNPLRHLVVS